MKLFPYENFFTYSYRTSLLPWLATSHIFLNPIGSNASPLGNAVPANAKNVVTIPMLTIARKPPTAINVEQATHRAAVIRLASALVTES